jgi:hypothetical protein
MSRSIGQLLRMATVLSAVALGLVACGPDYDHTDISAVRKTKLGGDMNIQRLEVPEGLVLKAHIVVWNDDEEAMPLVVRSKDPKIVEVAGVVNDRDYAFLGLQRGRTEIEFVADDTVVLTIEANVVAQPTVD